MAHAVLSASGCKRWMNCPGSVRMSEGMPDKTSLAGADGTAAHALAEICLTRDSDPAEYLGKELEGRTITEEMVDGVQLYLDAIHDDMQQYPEAKLRVEERMDLGWLYPGMFGTNDAVLAEEKGKLIVYDFKFGKEPVQVWEDGKPNPQLAYYALGAAHAGIYKEVDLVVVQPRCNHADGPVRRATMDIKDLKRWGKTVLLPAAQATESSDAPLTKGSYCFWCKGSPKCPLLVKDAVIAVGVRFDPIVEPHPITLPAPEAIPMEKMPRLFEFLSAVEAWKDSVLAYMQQHMEQGGHIPGFKLVAKKSNRAWTDERAVVERLGLLLGDELYNRKIKSPKQMEDTVKAIGRDPKSMLAGLYHQPDLGVAIAPESDRRRAVPPPSKQISFEPTYLMDKIFS